MAGEWKEVPLGEAYDFSSGLSKPRSEFGFGHGFVTFKNVLDNFFVPPALSALVNSTDKERAGCSIERGDVFLTRTSETQEELGMSCVALKDYAHATFNGFTKRLRPKSGVTIVPEYAGYYFRGPRFRQAVTAMSSLSTRASLNNEMLSRLSIVLPPLSVQASIGRILKSLDDKIELNRRINATLEGISRAIFKSWFVDFDPVRQKAAGEQPVGMDAQTAALFPDSFEDSEIGEVPKGWAVVRASDLYEVAIGKTPPRKEHQWFSESPVDIPWMSIKDLGEAGAFILNVSEYLTTEAVAKFRVRRIPNGTVVLSFKLTVGRVAITDGEMLSNEAIAHFLPLQPESPAAEYLYCYLKQFDFGRLGSTSSIATAVNSESVRSIPIAVPCERLVALFCQQVRPQFRQTRLLQRESRTLAALRDTLLPKLLSGEVRVPEAEETVEEVLG